MPASSNKDISRNVGKSLIFGSDAICITVNFDENKIYVTWIIISILDASKKRRKSRRRFKNAHAFLLGFYSVYSVSFLSFIRFLLSKVYKTCTFFISSHRKCYFPLSSKRTLKNRNQRKDSLSTFCLFSLLLRDSKTPRRL